MLLFCGVNFNRDWIRGLTMEQPNLTWDTGLFHRRLSTFAHAAIIITLATFWLIQLEGVLQPLFIALGIYFVLKPGATMLSENGFPIFLSYLTMLMFTLLIVTSAGFFAYQQANELVSDEDKMDNYNVMLDEKWLEIKSMPFIGDTIVETVGSNSSTLGDDLSKFGLLGNGQELSDVVTGMVSGVGDIITTSVTVMFFLIFIIFEASLLPGRIERAWPGGASEKVQIIRAQIEDSVNSYVVVKTGVGIGTAAFAGAIMWAFGIDLWFTWALLTFLFNYVPYIGSLIATVPPIVLGLVLLEPTSLVALAIMLLVNQQLWGNVIETKWAGRALDLSPVLLLLVTAFSFWVWGVLGMILAIPFTVIIKICLENIEATRPLAILLSERAPSMDEAWRDALRDGKISEYESKALKELQEVLGYSDEQVKAMAAKAAIETIHRKGRVTTDEIELILNGAACFDDTREYEAILSTTLVEGKLDPEAKDALADLEDLFDVHCEEE